MGISYSSRLFSTFGLLCGAVLLSIISSASLSAQDDVEPPEPEGRSTFDLTGTSFIETQIADQQGVGSFIPEKPSLSRLPSRSPPHNRASDPLTTTVA